MVTGWEPVSEIRGSELAGAGVSGARPSHNSRSHAGHWAGTGHVTSHGLNLNFLKAEYIINIIKANQHVLGTKNSAQ